VVARYLLTLALSPHSMPEHCSFLYQRFVAELADSHMTQVRYGWLTLRRAKLPFANNPSVTPGVQGE
jgi:hypothetical protein